MRNKPAPNYLLLFILLIIGAIGVVVFYFAFKSDQINENPLVSVQDDASSQGIPELKAETILNSLDHPWDIVFIDENSYVFTERNNKINYVKNKEIFELNAPEDTYAEGEGGMMGLAVDPEFDSNHYIYACFNSEKEDLDVRVARFELNTDTKSLSNRKDIITKIPSNNSGRHSGCQLEFGPQGYLWVGTGDAADHTTAQNPKSLGGKILRIDRNGKGAPENDNPIDQRIFSYGHRNVQGLGFFSSKNTYGIIGISVEHGPDTDDEVNPLLQSNFGWDPLPNYGEDVPMTDINKYPDATEAIWSSGRPTLATSGGTVIKGDEWKDWDQAIAVAALKGSRVIVLEIDDMLNVTRETYLFENEYGRIRTIEQGPDGDLYLLTDNGGGKDSIIKITPK